MNQPKFKVGDLFLSGFNTTLGVITGILRNPYGEVVYKIKWFTETSTAGTIEEHLMIPLVQKLKDRQNGIWTNPQSR
jgi:hypothetical protein